MSDPIQPSPTTTTTPFDKPTPDVKPAGSAEKSELLQDASATAPSPAIDLKTLTDRALHFLATASNETIGACLVGLSAGTYLVLGRVGLLLIGVVGGVVLHATWEGQSHGEGDNKAQKHEARRRELGADVARRVLDWRGNVTQGKDKTLEDASHSMDVKLYAGKELDFSDFRPETAAALTELTDAVIRDYVKYVRDPVWVYVSNHMQMVVFANHSFGRDIPCVLSTNSNSLPHIRFVPPRTQTAR